MCSKPASEWPEMCASCALMPEILILDRNTFKVAILRPPVSITCMIHEFKTADTPQQMPTTMYKQ